MTETLSKAATPLAAPTGSGESDAVREIRRLRSLPGNCPEANALLDEAIRVQLAAEAPTATAALNWRDVGNGYPKLDAMASSLRAGHYCTGHPEYGWVLFSMGGGCWHQRTEREFPPMPGLKPVRLGGRWVWSGVSPNPQ